MTYQRPLQEQGNDVARFAAWLGGALFLLYIGKTVGRMGSDLINYTLTPESVPVRLPQTKGWHPAYIAFLKRLKGKTLEDFDIRPEPHPAGLRRRYYRAYLGDEIIVGAESREEVLSALNKLLQRAKALPNHTLKPQALLIEGGELVPPQYRDLVSLVSEPLPEYSLLTLPAVVPEAGERKIDAVLKQLKDGVEGIQDSYQFRLFLGAMSKFHDYSIGNLILIALQKPDAIRVAGFNTWKDLGRWVKKGEKGISILAPVMPPRPTCPECGARVSRGVSFCPECGASVEEVQAAPAPHRFKVVHVFDLSQTEGKELPEFEVPVLTGEVNEELFDKLLALMKVKGTAVSFEPRPHLDPGIKGQYSPPAQIWVRPEEPRAQQLKTLIHEIAHYYSEGVFRIPRQDAETIAESSAFVVGAHYGFDTGVRSFPYVALWAKDKKVLEQNLGAIRRVATAILGETEK